MLVPAFMKSALLGLCCCLTLSGCSSTDSYIKPSAQEQVGEANRLIERSRAFQRFAVFAAPKERQVEQLLKRDERFASARFALQSYWFDVGTFYDFYFPAPAELSFDLVIETNVPISEADISQSIVSALGEAGLRVHAPLDLYHHDNQWAITFGEAWLQPADPADGASLEAILREEIRENGKPALR
jgi:hypothetical protein